MSVDYNQLASLAQAHGSAFYLMDASRYRQNIDDFLQAFRSIYPRTGIGHSYKTNYLPALCRTAYGAGAYAEVVSGMEYDLAIRLGAAPPRIIVNGPIKSAALLTKALGAGAIVNVDSLQEAETIARLARDSEGAAFRVGIRVNFPLPGLSRSRFGIDAESADLARAAAVLRGASNCRLSGIHCHFGGDRTAESFSFRAGRMIELADRLFAGAAPEFVDVGGGFAGRLAPALAAQLPYRVPSYADYAEAVAQPFARRYGSRGPELIVEPGMGVLGDVLEFACTVTATKQVGGRNLAITSGSIYHIKPTLNRMDLPARVVSRQPLPSGSGRVWSVSGHTCMEIDVMHTGLSAAIEPGDFILFENVGAYTIVLKPPFIEPAPAVLERIADGSFSVAKRAETLDDILGTYIV